jgi:glycosyltransferase involved in cell wall biosynthesis
MDNTFQVAKEIEDKHSDIVKSIRIKHSGPGPAREAGRLLAKGEFIQYLDSDDLLRPNKFDLQVKALREHPECGVAYGYVCLHKEDGSVLSEPFKWSGQTISTLFPKLLVDRWWNTDTVLFRRSVTDAVGPWSNLRWSQDWEYDARVGALGTKLAHVKEYVCDQRVHSGEKQSGRGNWMEPDRLLNRVDFLRLLYSHARKAGVTSDAPEMQHFARWVFTIARHCGAIGLIEESKECFAIALEATGKVGLLNLDFKAYRALCYILGWKGAGRFSCFVLDQKSRKPGPKTLKQSWMD